MSNEDYYTNTDDVMWINEGNKLVGFFDIMGFENYIDEKGHEATGKLLNKIRQIVNQVEHRSGVISDAMSDEDAPWQPTKIRCVVFSDTVLLISRDDTNRDFLNFLNASGQFLHKCFEEGIPIKGAISYGLCTADFDNSLFYGTPIIKAYKLQEKLYVYGAALDDILLDKLDGLDTHLNFSWEPKLSRKPVKIKTTKIEKSISTEQLVLLNWWGNKDKKTILERLLTDNRHPSRIQYVENTLGFKV